MQYFQMAGTGILIGLLNGLFGAGGGIVAVTAFQKMGMPDKVSHATAIAVMMFLSAVSGFLYWYRGFVSVSDVIPFLPGGVAGAAFGGWLLPKIPDFWLKKIFSLFILYAAVRLFLK
ncbi:MAG: sulfite exporter TauE/SafE family protein [Oscillospiraceae bacterium]|nr:sulfite exporter TauE/SafE family protein [Oscillospiraceae bacterium]